MRRLDRALQDRGNKLRKRTQWVPAGLLAGRVDKQPDRHADGRTDEQPDDRTLGQPDGHTNEGYFI